MRQITRWRGGWRNVLVLSLAAVLIGGVAAYGAGDIKTKLPEKSVLYLEFAGADRFSEANRTTPFGALLRDPQFAKLTSALWAAGDKALADNAAKEGKGEVYAAAKDMALMLWHKGVAIDVIGATVAGGAAGAADAPAGGV